MGGFSTITKSRLAKVILLVSWGQSPEQDTPYSVHVFPEPEPYDMRLRALEGHSIC